MALALNKLKRVDMPLNKKPKPNQTRIKWMIKINHHHHRHPPPPPHHHHHHHQVVLIAWIFALALSLSLSLSLSWSPLLLGLLYDNQCPYRSDEYLPALVSPCVGVHGKKVAYEFAPTSLEVLSISCSSWIVCEMGDKWLYSCCFVGCCFQNKSEKRLLDMNNYLNLCKGHSTFFIFSKNRHTTFVIWVSSVCKVNGFYKVAFQVAYLKIQC